MKVSELSNKKKILFSAWSRGISTFSDEGAFGESQQLYFENAPLPTRAPEYALRGQHDPGGGDLSGKTKTGKLRDETRRGEGRTGCATILRTLKILKRLARRSVDLVAGDATRRGASLSALHSTLLRAYALPDRFSVSYNCFRNNTNLDYQKLDVNACTWQASQKSCQSKL